MANREISPEFLGGLLDVPNITKEDELMHARFVLMTLMHIKNVQVRENGEWDHDKTFDGFTEKELHKMNSIVNQENIDRIALPKTELNTFGHFVISYITDTINLKN